MDIPVNLPGMEGQNVALRLAGTFAGPKLMLNGQPVAKKDGLFQLRTNTGAPLDVKLKARFLDPIPNLQVSGRTIQLLPALAWYQYLWMSIPILLVFTGGAIGGFCGGAAAMTSSRIFRSDLENGKKYALTGLISVAAFISYFIIAAAITMAMGKK
jgi:hypothetical protein